MFAFLSYYCTRILVPMVWLNQWTRYQVKFLLEIIFLLKQLNMNKEILYAEPENIQNRLIRKAVKHYRS